MYDLKEMADCIMSLSNNHFKNALPTPPDVAL